MAITNVRPGPTTRRGVFTLLVLTVFPLGVVHATAGDVGRGDADAWQRPLWTTSRVVGRPGPRPPYRINRVFPNLKFKNPVYFAQEPGTERFIVAELGGKIYAVELSKPDADQTELFLETKRQIYSFSFHPDYEKNGVVFVFSPKDPADKSKKSRVSRFRAGLRHPRRCRADTEEIIIEWPSGGHNGGEAIIGPDGYLYVSTGDGTSGSDPNATGQGVDDLFSVILRIDVDHPAAGERYSIPPDNPFVGFPGARGEVWAHGFRNPWRMSFDPGTGKIWVGDVGQDLWEMIWLVQKGGNYGWSVQEGSHPFHPYKQRGPGPILPPVAEHHHSVCRSIVGGYVYQGEKLPELKGVYFYGDHEYGKIWGLKHDGEKVVWQRELADTPIKIVSFTVSRAGDIYTADHLGGEIFVIERNPARDDTASFPMRLSETGLFTSVKDHKPAPGVVPYSVNAPFWSDGAFKTRMVAVPDSSQITFGDGGGGTRPWEFEDGAVLVKSYALEMKAGNPESRRWIETRLLVKQENHWLGYSYRWNDEQTDAVLVDGSGKDIDYDIEDTSVPGGTRVQKWHYPSRNECMFCHSRAAGFVLGLNTLQMNRQYAYGHATDNQLYAFERWGLFKKPLPKKVEEYPSMPDPSDTEAGLEGRVRAYLHVNCAMCHVADGGGNSHMELRYDTDMAKTKILDVPAVHEKFGVDDARLVAAGFPDRSILLLRAARRGKGQMPPVGSHVVDERGTQLLRQWIAQLTPGSAQRNVELHGRVIYTGPIPKPVFVPESGVYRHAIERNTKTGGLKDAIVWLEGVPTLAVEKAVSETPLRMDQQDFLFSPRVLGVREGRTVRFANSDGANHGVQAISIRAENRFNLITAPSEDYVHRFVADKYPVRVECSLHSWMGAWIFVFDHPYFAVTDGDGKFRLPEVPPGTYTIEVRHPETGMRRRQEVSMTANLKAPLQLEFTESDRTTKQ